VEFTLPCVTFLPIFPFLRNKVLFTIWALTPLLLLLSRKYSMLVLRDELKINAELKLFYSGYLVEITMKCCLNVT